MAYTIAQQNQSFFEKAKPVLKYLGLFVLLAAFAYGITMAIQRIPSMRKTSAISATVENGRGVVFIDGKSLGETPVQKVDVKPGTHETEIVSVGNPDLFYRAKLEYNAGTETTLFRDLGVSELFSSGKNFWMEKGVTSLTVISEPSGAKVYLDGSEMGKTPITLDKVTEGSYKLSVRKEGYESTNAEIRVNNGYKLNVSTKLFPIPLPDEILKFEGSKNLFDLTIANQSIAESPHRAKAVVYWASTRGFGDEVSDDFNFDYFIDAAGNVYNSQGMIISTPEEFKALENAKIGGYLGVGQVGTGLSEPAKETYLSLFGDQQTGTILSTGVGWLRVRTEPTLGASELTKVNVGETFPVLEVRGEWAKIQVANGQSGWVSGTYVEISQ